MMNDQNYSKQFQTPIPVCEYMASLLPLGVKTVLEPTPGEGNIVTTLQSRGYEVTAPGDYFVFHPYGSLVFRFDAVVMNPPFTDKYAYTENDRTKSHKKELLGYRILTECMEMSDIVIALMPIFTLIGSDRRYKEINSFGLKSVIALPRRTFKYARVQTAILELHKGFQGETTFKYFQ